MSQVLPAVVRRDFSASSPDLAALIAEKDWSTTLVGSPDQWSPALRMMVDHVLGNGFGLLLWWGPQYVQFYNDAYRPVLGTKHPRSLGQPAAECFAEIWDIIGPMVDRPFRGGAPSVTDDLYLEVDRYGFLEETHFTVAYSPVFDETAENGIGGVIATVHEITEKIIGERRIRLLGELSARAAEAQTAEEACRIAAEVLASDPRDIPFAQFYLFDSAGTASLVAEYGTGASDDAFCNVAAALESGANVILSNGSIAVPIPAARLNEFAGVLVAGTSPHLALTDTYRTFFDLVAAPIGTAITNARAYEEERKRAEALAELDRAKNVFFSNVSHEFRTPLTLMLGPLAELSKIAEGTSAALVETAHRNSLRLLKLVNTLLEFSRMEAGRVDATFVQTDLAELTRDLCGAFRSVIESAGLKFSVDIDLVNPVYVDGGMWEKIVLNLLSNAFKFTMDGEIRVVLTRVSDHAELRVEDTGVGIPDPDLPHVFERFRRVRNVEGRSHEGSGIGLALTHDLVQLHGGTLDVRSKIGCGSVFCVRVPLGDSHLDASKIVHATTRAAATAATIEQYLADVASTIAPRTGEAPEPSNGAIHRSRVLLVDDNWDLRNYLSRILAPHYDVSVASHGLEALELVRMRRYDLILSDVMMPKMDGMELLAALRQDPELSHLPFLFLSARAGEEAAVDGLERGADGYLVKPFSAEELIARTEALLRGVRKRESHVLNQASGRWFERPGDDTTNESIFHAFADHLPVMIYQYDAAGELCYANAVWHDTLHIPRDGDSYPSREWREVVHPEDFERTRAVIAAAISSRSSYALEYRIKPRDGDESAYRWHEARAIPQFGTAGEFRGWIGTIVDTHDAREREERQAQIARSFQDAALPSALAEVPGIAFSGLYEPASTEDRVGGDFYDAFRLLDGRVVFSIGDVAGSGLGAATTMAAIRQSIRAAASINPDPQQLLKAAEGVFLDHRHAPFASVFVAVIDPLTFSMQYANAGHLPPLLRLPSGDVIELNAHGLLLGVNEFSGQNFRQVPRLTVEPGSFLILYTDGLTEITHDPESGEARLLQAVRDLKPATSVAQATRIVRDAVIGPGRASSDDVAVLAVSIGCPLREAEPRSVRSWQFSSDCERDARRARNNMVGMLRDAGLSAEQLFNAETVFSELIGNTTRHARGVVDVVLDLTQESPVLHVLDRGPGFALNPKLPAPYAERGRGLYIVHRLTRECTSMLRDLPPGTHVRAVLSGTIRA